MDAIIGKLGELLLGSVPTAIFLLVLYGLYTVLVHRPLIRVLAERRSKTEGAMEKARADVAMAEARTDEYEQRLREARLAVFKAQESRRQAALEARTAAVAQARARAQAEVEKARAAIEEDKEKAKAAFEAEAGKMAAEIIRTVLRPTPAAAGGQ